MHKNWKKGGKLNSHMTPNNGGNRRFGVRGRLPGGNGVMGGYWWAEAFEHEDTGDDKTPGFTQVTSGGAGGRQVSQSPSGWKCVGPSMNTYN